VAQDIKEAIDLCESDQRHWQKIYNFAKDDARFLSAEEGCQWIPALYQSRRQSGRATLQIDHTAQLINAVVNQIRMKTPAIKMIAGDGTDKETAEIFQYFIRGIEYTSNADDAYDLAAQCAVRMSIGFIRVDREYASDLDFNQRLCIKRVVNPLAVYLDGNSIELDGSDAMHCTVLDVMTKEAFAREYPKENPVSFQVGQPIIRNDNENVIIAEQFTIKEEKAMIGLRPDGVIEMVEKDGEYKLTREIKKRKVWHAKMSGAGYLEEPRLFPGKYVPIVPVYGEEFWNEGKRHLVSLVRRARDSQMLYNYWKSVETDVLDNQPQAPFIAALGATEGLEGDYKNPGKTPVIRYNAFDENGNPLPAPQRTQPPVASAGLFQASQSTLADIKATTGVYDTMLGAKSNETSGTAIAQRTQQSDVLTYHFGDNLSKSVRQVGRVLQYATADVNDTPQVIRIVNNEDEVKEVGINGMRVEGQERDYFLNKGQFDIKVTTTLPYTTRRAETAAFLGDVVRSNPEMLSVIGDKLMESMDMAGSEVIAERLKKMLPPALRDEEENGQINAVMQENEQLKQAVQTLQQGEQAKLQSEANKQQTERIRAEASVVQAQTELKIAEIESAVKMATLQFQQKELELRELELQKNFMQSSMNPSPSGDE
jgi:hypothetical protein